MVPVFRKEKTMDEASFVSAVIGIAAGVLFGNLLPFPKHIWDKITLGGGVALVGCVGWVVYRAL